MTNSTNLDETRIKTLFKEALVEVIEENQELVSSILIDALEDIGLSRAIEEGDNGRITGAVESFAKAIASIYASNSDHRRIFPRLR